MTIQQGRLTQLARAEPGDAFALAALELQRARELGRAPEPGFIDVYADCWLADRGRRPAWLATSLDGTALGSIVLHVRLAMPSPGLRRRADAVIDTLYVSRIARREGIGERLLRAALFWCSQMDIRALHAEATPEAAPLMHRLGFAPAGDHALVVRMR